MQESTGVGPPPHLKEADVSPNEAIATTYLPVPEQNSTVPTHPPSLSGGLPPQQVYVNPPGDQIVDPAINGLGSQFSALGIGQENINEQNSRPPEASADGSSNAIEENDGEDTEDDPLKLFVGQVRCF